LKQRLSAEIRAGVALLRGSELRFPGEGAWFRRLAWGAALVVGTVRALLSNPVSRARYLRVVGVQLTVTVLAGLWYVDFFDELPAFYEVRDGTFRFSFSRGTALISSLYGTLCMVEWMVIALSRDFHDELSRMASALVGVPPEDSPCVPRIRLDVRWLMTKLRRRLRGLAIFACGLPLIGMCAMVPVIGDVLQWVAFAGWGLYWLAVFTVGRTAYAWAEPATLEPWYLRGAAAAVQSTPVLRWWLPTRFLAFWRRVTGTVTRPARLVEQMPFEAVGLALMRVLGGIPGVYLFLRPAMPVAAARALLERGLAKPTALSPQALKDAAVDA
jgi:hypothetical protein